MTTTTDWRTHDTPEFRSAFQDAQMRLDDAEIRTGGGYCAPGVEHYTSDMMKADEELTDRYDRLVLQPAQAEFERQCDDAEFALQYPEPPDGARIEFDADGTVFGAYRQDDPDREGYVARWYLYGSDEAWQWRDLVVRYQIDMGDLTVLGEVTR